MIVGGFSHGFKNQTSQRTEKWIWFPVEPADLFFFLNHGFSFLGGGGVLCVRIGKYAVYSRGFCGGILTVVEQLSLHRLSKFYSC